MREKWNQRYAEQDISKPSPASVLADYSYLLPATGLALDLACGLGGNAVYLARQRLDVTAWDISDVAIARLNSTARTEDLSLRTQVRDVELQPPTPISFDVIVVSYFLSRSLFAPIAAALRPGGVLFYQTFGIEQPAGISGPYNPQFRLQPNELIKVFSDLRVLVYRDEGLVGDSSQGLRNTVMLVAQKV